MMVSIIVPAYNAERYLGACVESIISQSETDWELLLVDDGSTDTTGKLCDEYMRADSRIRAIHRENGGLSAARNTGIDSARGDYITFLDSDDVFAPTFLERTLAAVRETGAEIAGTSYEPFNEEIPVWRRRAECERRRIESAPRRAVIQALYQRGLKGSGARMESSAWGKLYAKSLWEGIRFREGQWYEDLDIFYRLWPRAGKIVFIPEALMGYRQHGGSFLHTATLRRSDVLDVTDRMVRYYEKEKDAELLRAARTRRFAAHWNIYLLLKQHKIVNSEIEGRCRKIISESRGEVLKNRAARLKDRMGGLIGYIITK